MPPTSYKFYVAILVEKDQVVAYSPDFNETFTVGENYEASLNFEAQQFLEDKLKKRQDLLINPHLGHAVVAMRVRKYATMHRIPFEDILDIKPVIVTLT